MNYSKNYYQMATPCRLFNAIEKKELGQIVKELFPVGIIYCCVKSYGGTEAVIDGILKIEDTLEFYTWYNPNIKASSIIEVEGAQYEIMGTPEDIELRHVYHHFKAKRLKNGC